MISILEVIEKWNGTDEELFQLINKSWNTHLGHIQCSEKGSIFVTGECLENVKIIDSIKKTAFWKKYHLEPEYITEAEKNNVHLFRKP